MDRIYHHYSLLEETGAGLWRVVTGNEMRSLNSSAELLMKNIKRFSASMHRVISEWRYSCEHNLSSIQSNRIAWIGQAAVCIATGAPESCARVSWYNLTKTQKEKANMAAAIAIKKWESSRLFGYMIQLDLPLVRLW